jgi:hypothetical protein
MQPPHFDATPTRESRMPDDIADQLAKFDDAHLL